MADHNSDHHFGLAVSLSIEALKALLLLNGGAATALIALTDKTQGTVPYGPAVAAFGFGAFLTVVAFACGYFSQLAYANHRFAHDHEQDGKNAHVNHLRWQRGAIVCVVLAFVAWVLGMLLALCATPLR